MFVGERFLGGFRVLFGLEGFFSVVFFYWGYVLRIGYFWFYLKDLGNKNLICKNFFIVFILWYFIKMLVMKLEFIFWFFRNCKI